MDMLIRTAYGERYPVNLSFEGVEELTEQHHKEMCEINTILKKYDKTGLITHVNNAKASYGDYSEVNEYQESLNIVIRAQDDFAQLPSDIRKRFGNDPGLFLEFVTDPKNMDQMVEMGLAVKPEPVPPIEVTIAANDSDPIVPADAG